MGFDRFMERALYTPGLGYYSSGKAILGHGPGDGSDFVTAPELTPLFGEVLARQLLQALQATQTREIWEFGAGSGALAEQLLGELGDRIDRYTIMEVSAHLRDRQHARLLHAHPELVHKVVWADSLPGQIEAVLVGNEVLDAMPVRLLCWSGQAWLERGVALDATGDFIWQDRAVEGGLRPPTTHADGEYAGGHLTELHEQAQAFVRSLAACVSRGAAFFIDYGFPEREYHLPQRHGGTVMCHRGHQSDPDPLRDVGDKDLTAHVDFTAVALAAQEAGWEVLGYTSQGRFLSNCGLGEALARTGQALGLADIRSRSALQMLVAEHEMGELFKVLGLVKGPWFEAIGFAHGDRTHTL